MQQERKLPIGIQSFEIIRKGGYVYVDKTELVYKLASLSTPFFLSRPRRFGKSLLISTLEAYFLGKKELFQGLAMEKLETVWDAYPVLRLDLNAKAYRSLEELNAVLNSQLEEWERIYGDEKKERSPEERFEYIIKQAYEQNGKPVVVLIDEYDKPMLQAILDESLSDILRLQLKAFYGVLKSSSDYLRFVFITGVTKFAQVSVFSDLNQLDDISMKPQYAAVCGITRQELIDNFTSELQRLAEARHLTFNEAIEKMTAMYDGYHFSEYTEGMYNPFSVLNVLDGLLFKSYWFQTGTPTYLVNLLQHSNFDLRLLIDGMQVDSSEFSEYRADAANPIPMIYQSGYLTISNYDDSTGLYTLNFPNEEVKYGFLKFLMPYYSPTITGANAFHYVEFAKELATGDTAAFINRLRIFFAKFPYELSNENEKHYQGLFYAIFTLLGQHVEAEIRSAHGRADAVVKTANYIYVFEFKLDGSAEEALKQIDTKEYLLPYALDGRKLKKVGVNFSSQTRNIDQVIEE